MALDRLGCAGERHWFTPADEPNKNLWFTADPQSIAAAKGLTGVAPFYVEQESLASPGGLQKPGKLMVTLPDNHLQIDNVPRWPCPYVWREPPLPPNLQGWSRGFASGLRG